MIFSRLAICEFCEIGNRAIRKIRISQNFKKICFLATEKWILADKILRGRRVEQKELADARVPNELSANSSIQQGKSSFVRYLLLLATKRSSFMKRWFLLHGRSSSCASR